MSILGLAAGAIAYAVVSLLSLRAPHALSARHRPALLAAAAGFAVAGFLSSGHPTAVPAADALLRVSLAVACVFAGRYARRRVLVSVALVAVAVSIGTPWLCVAAAVLGALIPSVAGAGRRSLVNAASGGALALVALHARWPDFDRGTSLAAAAIMAPVLVSAWHGCPRRSRRRLRNVMLVISAGGALAAALVGVGAVWSRAEFEHGVSQLDDAIAAAQRGDTAGSLLLLAQANRDFRSAQNRARVATPGLVVPVAAQHVRVLWAAATGGVHTTSAAGAVMASLAGSDLHVSGGRLPIDELRSIRRPLAATEDAIGAAQRAISSARSPWLLAPVADQLDRALTQLGLARSQVRTARIVADELPAVVGADGPRTYFLAVQTPSESRSAGGMIGNFGEISANGGRLVLERLGRTADLNRAAEEDGAVLHLPDDYAARYSLFEPERSWQNVTMSPDFPTVARVIAELYPQSGGHAIDGVIAVDPAGLGAILRAVGPVTVSAWPVPITAENAERVLLYEQYVRLDSPDRVDFLGDVTREVWKRLTTSGSSLPGLAASVGEAIAQKHIQFASTHPEEEAVLAAAHAASSVAPAEGDFLAVLTQNAGGNKIDWFLRRSITYDVDVESRTGAVQAEVRTVLTNGAPSSGLPRYVIGSATSPPLPPGTNKMYVSWYTPWNLVTASIDGHPLELSSQREFGRNVYSAFLEVPAGGSVTVTLRLAGALADPSSYALVLHRQPLPVADAVAVNASLSRDGHIIRNGLSLLLDRDRRIAPFGADAGWAEDLATAVPPAVPVLGPVETLPVAPAKCAAVTGSPNRRPGCR